ncbi:active regulator of SIRT1-like [Limulus polyphemus]|uniref:Active regulator of SIRT1 n=1 Tax=Limulus polyphemus TaxID=6850 RepID=A0ABM1B510_LIMPO|nr:active regulator of SIRT1-like [Limulus polyphemus]
MSATLVRKTLDLDLSTSNRKLAPEIKDDMPTTKKGLKKLRKRLKQNNQKSCNKGIATVKDKKLKCIVEELRKKQQGDMTQENIELLKRLGGMKTKANTTKQILVHQQGRLSKNQPPTQKEEQSTVFTDKDFELFEREYMLIKPKKDPFFD